MFNLRNESCAEAFAWGASELQNLPCSATSTPAAGWADNERTSASHPASISFANAHDMQNLLRTLTASQVKSSLPESELKLLLSAVKETRVSV